MAKEISIYISIALVCLLILFVAVACEVTDVNSPDERITMRTEFDTYPAKTTRITVVLENNYDVDIWYSTEFVLEKLSGEMWHYVTRASPSFGYLIASEGDVLTPLFSFFDPDSLQPGTSHNQQSGKHIGSIPFTPHHLTEGQYRLWIKYGYGSHHMTVDLFAFFSVET